MIPRGGAGTFVIDQPETLADQTITALDPATDFIDIGRFQSVYVVMADLSGTANFGFVEFDIREGPTTRVIHQMQVSFTASSSWSALLPCFGNRLRVSTWVGDIAVQVFGSNRPVDTFKQEISNPLDALNKTALYSIFNTTIAAAGQLQIEVPPWYGRLHFNAEFGCAAAMGTSLVRRLYRDDSTLNHRTIWRGAPAATVTANQFIIEHEFISAGAAQRIIIANNSGAAFNSFNAVLVPGTGYGAV